MYYTVITIYLLSFMFFLADVDVYEQVHEIFVLIAYANRKASEVPLHSGSLTRAFSCLHIQSSDADEGAGQNISL